jgi:hypothetical protein
MFWSKVRAIISAVLSIIFVVISMNFSQRNVNILAQRSMESIIFDYILNIVLFFVVFYLLISLLTWSYLKIFKKL